MSVDDLVKVLKSIEWIKTREVYDGTCWVEIKECPVCLNTKAEGHNQECSIGKALASDKSYLEEDRIVSNYLPEVPIEMLEELYLAGCDRPNWDESKAVSARRISREISAHYGYAARVTSKTYVSCQGCFWKEGGRCYVEPCTRDEKNVSLKIAEGGCPRWANTLEGIREAEHVRTMINRKHGDEI